MKHSYFEIHNFKGINRIRLDFDAPPRSNVYTLVGLNESGKTTILEALNFLSYKPETLNPLNLPGYSVKDVHELIPISKRGNFNDAIQIKATYELDDDDKEILKEFLSKELRVRSRSEFSELTITQSYIFRNSEITRHQPVNTLSVGTNKKTFELEQWQTVFERIKNLLPSVLYFPNFLFEFPDLIYLEEVTTDTEKHEFYRVILQDVLDSIGDHMKLGDHILARAKDGSPNAKRALDAVLLKMSAHIGSTVFKNWDRIFKRTTGNKEIVISCDRDAAGLWFLQLRLKDSNELYSISERSLGFRWFFAFLLLTQYRGFRKGGPKNVLFLFDEPASNLHPSAQSQLLESFGRLQRNCSIVYTTHSHHMINPNWLEGAYVVRNEGLDYESEDDDYNARKTLITLDKYRNFAVRHPDQTTYFQPILDVLDYSPSKLENIPNVILVEGKNDFYTLKYFQEKIFNRGKALSLLPGSGAGSLDKIIRLYIAWGREFIVLLDSDESGEEQKKRYENLFGALVRNRVYSLGDIDPSWKRMEMEDLIQEKDRNLIQRSAYPNASGFNKTHFNRAIQELFLTDKKLNLSANTLTNFEKTIDFCSERLPPPSHGGSAKSTF
jgi:predicted ATP-dependent endonuclease of OLD family